MISNKSLAIIIIIALIALFFVFRGMINGPEYSDTQPYDTSIVDTTNYAVTDFLQIANLFDESRQNRVAFDKKYDEKTIEFDGNISEISNDYGCARITFKVTDENDISIGEVECSNCRADVDRWSDQIAKLKLNDYVRVKGIYSSTISSKYSLSFYSCKIIQIH